MSTAHDWLRRDGMTVREIAKALHISTNRVKQLEHRALEKLRTNPGLLAEFLGINDTIDSEHQCEALIGPSHSLSHTYRPAAHYAGPTFR